MNNFRKLAFIFAVLLAGCATVPKVATPPIAPPISPPIVQPPVFEKTFGEVSVGKSASLLFHYKTISILLDPDYDESAAAFLSPHLDYLFLTDASARHFSSGSKTGFRKNLKVVASKEEAEKIKRNGFGEVKVLSAGQRVLLKKNEDFVFVSAVQSHNHATGLQVNSYLLEFDNGRNVFISGEANDIDTLRELVYALRDDGKEISLGFFNPVLDNELLTAQMISLIQPKNALLVDSGKPSATKLNEASLRQSLKNELFDGPIVILKDGTSIPF